MANKYQDRFLTDEYVRKLDSAIALSRSNPVEALEVIDRLIVEAPRSPQLWVSKSIITPSKYVSERIDYCNRAIELDDSFYNGYYYLAKNLRLSDTTYCTARHTGARLNMVVQFQEFASIVSKGFDGADEYFAMYPDLFTIDWKDKYDRSLSIQMLGLSLMDRQSTSDSDYAELTKGFSMYNNTDPLTRKILVMYDLIRTLG